MSHVQSCGDVVKTSPLAAFIVKRIMESVHDDCYLCDLRTYFVFHYCLNIKKQR